MKNLRMRNFSLGLVLAAALCAPAAEAQQAIATTSSPTLTNGQQAPLNLSLSGRLRVETSPVAGGTQDTNLKQVNGATTQTGHGTAAGALRVELPTDGTGVVGLNAGSAIVGKVGIDQTTPGTTNGVQVNAALPAGGNTIGAVTQASGPWTENLTQVNSVAISTGAGAVGTGTQRTAVGQDVTTVAGATTCRTNVVSTTAESGHVLLAAAGSLCSLTVVVGATSGYVLVFDATSAPIDGAVTPAWWFPVKSDGTNGGAAVSWQAGSPRTFATGITAVFSTTGPFTKTASATASFSAQVQ